MTRTVLLLLVLLAACTERPAPDAADETGVAADDSAAPAPEAADLPPVKTDTLYLEGTPEPVTLRLFDEPGLPFTTYVPEGDFVAERVASGEGEGVRFEANFGGVRNPEAYVHIFFPAEEAGLDSLAALQRFVTDTLAARNGWQLEEPRAGAPTACAWAGTAYRFVRTEAGATYLGYACLGEHAGRPFYVAMQFPEEYAEGFGPRTDLLLRELRWRDTGAPLAAPHP